MCPCGCGESRLPRSASSTSSSCTRACTIAPRRTARFWRCTVWRRKAAIVLEARESLLMRLAVRLGFTNDFELEAVTSHGLESGGMRNGPIPNLNYRWTEAGSDQGGAGRRSRLRREHPLFLRPAPADAALRQCRCTVPPSRAQGGRAGRQGAGRLFPTQGNEFGFVIFKTGQLREWLELRDGRLRVSERRRTNAARPIRSTRGGRRSRKESSSKPSKEPSDA